MSVTNTIGRIEKDLFLKMSSSGTTTEYSYPHFFHGLPTDDNLNRFYRQRKEHDFDDTIELVKEYKKNNPNLF